MKLFVCQACANILYYENRACGRCGHRLAFMPERVTLPAIEGCDSTWKTLADGGEGRVLCANAGLDACNWLLEPGETSGYCRACRHNGTVPDLSDPARLSGWRELEWAKHRLFYSLIRWELPVKTRAEDNAHGLIFNFLADDPVTEQKVMTGHDNGLITIALTEADDIERERRRLEMGEPYRTLLGHFRHEVGHYFWDILVRDGGKLDACRAVFGDDSMDYGEALRRHYAEGPPPNWQQRFVSAYATTHPWEDFAETWAHYLHIVDTLERWPASSVWRCAHPSTGPVVSRRGSPSIPTGPRISIRWSQHGCRSPSPSTAWRGRWAHATFIRSSCRPKSSENSALSTRWCGMLQGEAKGETKGKGGGLIVENK